VGAYRQVAFDSEPRPGQAIPATGDLRRRDSTRPAAAARAKPGPGGIAIAYCLVMGFLAVVAGAAASLAVSGSARIAVWCVVTVCAAAVSGVSYPVLPVAAVLGAISARMRLPARD
jgi:hypothetical protein